MVQWDDLAAEEKQALERLFSHVSFPVLRATANRLVTLGLAEQKADGVALNQAGEELVVQHSRRM